MSRQPDAKPTHKIPLHTRTYQVVAGQIFTNARILKTARLRHGWRIHAVTDQGRISFRAAVLDDERNRDNPLSLISIHADGVVAVRSLEHTPTTLPEIAPAPGYQSGDALASIAPPDTPAVKWALDVLPGTPRVGLSASGLANAIFAHMRGELHGVQILDPDLLTAQTPTKTPPQTAPKHASVLRYQTRHARLISRVCADLKTSSSPSPLEAMGRRARVGDACAPSTAPARLASRSVHRLTVAFRRSNLRPRPRASSTPSARASATYVAARSGRCLPRASRIPYLRACPSLILGGA